MKLERSLSNLQRERVQTALGLLQSTHAAFESKLAAFGLANEALANLERQHRAAGRHGHLSPGERRTLEGLAAQLAKATEKAATAKQEMEAARQSAAEAIQHAGLLISKVCAPLLEQFSRGLFVALQPFYTDAAGTVADIQDRHTERPALQSFLSRGQHISRRAVPEEIERLAFDLGRTLQNILAGAEIWRPVGQPAAV